MRLTEKKIEANRERPPQLVMIRLRTNTGELARTV